jgi:hypothetical protein
LRNNEVENQGIELGVRRQKKNVGVRGQITRLEI